MQDGWIEPSDLVDAGYRTYPPPPVGYGDALHQKCVRLDDVKLYYIDMCMHDFKGMLPPYDGYQIRFEPRAQLRLPDGTHFNVKLLLLKDQDVNYVETFFADVFWRLGCMPYEGTLGPLTQIGRNVTPHQSSAG